MSGGKRILGKTFAELDAQAKEAVRRAVADLHARGIATYHLEGGKIIETDRTARCASWMRRRRTGQGRAEHDGEQPA